MLLSETESVTPGVAKAAALPVAAAPPVQPELVNTSTVEPASAVPTIFGLLLLAGPTGDIAIPLGVDGAAESSTNEKEVEELGETLPAASVAVA